MQNNTPGATKPFAVRPPVFPLAKAASSPQEDVSDAGSSSGNRVVDSLTSATLLAFTGGSLDAFLYLNHGHVYAGVMTGNAVLCGVAVFNHSVGGAMHYVSPLFAYVCGISLIAVLQQYVKRHSVRLALALVGVGLLALSFVPKSFPEQIYIFLVVLLTGFLVGIARRVDTYSYNATVLTGSLRDATISLYQALNPAMRAENLRKSRDLWMVMFSFLTGAAVGGLLGKHIGNHALWLPVGVVGIVLTMVLQGAKGKAQS